MGMFLTKYSMLNLLSENNIEKINKGEWWHKEQFDETQKILSKYKLIGFVIHDPRFHFDFDDKFNEIFEKLDFLTGQQFLFFGLTNPSKEWKERVKGRDYFGIWEKELLLNPGNTYATYDPSISTYSLINILDIEYDDLPVIVLTSDLNKNKFSVVKTCDEHLEKQLSDIGFFCEQNKDENIEDKFPELLKNLNLCNGVFENQLYNTLANALSNFLSFVVKSNPNSKDIQTAVKQVSTVTNSIIHKKELFNDSEFERLNLFLVGAFLNSQVPRASIPYPNVRVSDIMLSPSTYSADEEPFYVNLNDAERESQIISNTFNSLLPVYTNFINKNLEDNFEIDYTPIAFCLCKIFEIETNLSLVQWIRKELDIEMPLYFKKHKKDNKSYTVTPSAKIISNPKPIDFNQGRNQKWIAPGIGQSELVIQSFFAEKKLPNEIKDYAKLLECWAIIRQLRNKAAHTELIDEKGFQKLKDSYKDLKKYDVFSQYNVLKNRLQNKKPLQ